VAREGRPGRLLEVEPYLLHGVQYYRLLIEWSEDHLPARREARVSYDVIYEEPRVGDEVEVVAILNIVDKIIKAD
jgi:hypothetical protein